MSWQRIRVAIPVTNPAPITRIGTMADFETPKTRGARRYWAVWYPESRLMVLHASIPMRSNLSYDDAALGAAVAARDFWNDGNLALGMAQLEGPNKLACWTWPEGENP